MSRVCWIKNGITDIANDVRVVPETSGAKHGIPGQRYMEFPGVSANFNADNSAPFLSSSVGSISLWTMFYDTSFGFTYFMIRIKNATGNGFLRFTWSSGNVISARCANDAGVNQWDAIYTFTDLAENQMVHFGIVQDGVEPIFYINGIPTTFTFTISTDKTQWINSFTQTQFDIGDNSMNGRIADLQIWDEILPQSWYEIEYEQNYKYF